MIESQEAIKQNLQQFYQKYAPKGYIERQYKLRQRYDSLVQSCTTHHLKNKLSRSLTEKNYIINFYQSMLLYSPNMASRLPNSSKVKQLKQRILNNHSKTHISPLKKRMFDSRQKETATKCSVHNLDKKIILHPLQINHHSIQNSRVQTGGQYCLNPIKTQSHSKISAKNRKGQVYLASLLSKDKKPIFLRKTNRKNNPLLISFKIDSY